MVAAERARELLSMHGVIQPQPPDDWRGMFPLPTSLERFFQEVGPADITIEGYGNPYFLPRTSRSVGVPSWLPLERIDGPAHRGLGR